MAFDRRILHKKLIFINLWEEQEIFANGEPLTIEVWFQKQPMAQISCYYKQSRKGAIKMHVVLL